MNSRLPRLTAFVILIAAVAIAATQVRGRSDEEGAAGEGAAASVAAALPNTNTARAGLDESLRSVGDKLLLQAATQLERRSSVSARLRHQVFLAGSQLYGVGSYWQQGSGGELKVRLELQIAGQDASLLQISNGRFFWVDRQLPTGRHVSRIDLRQLRSDPILTATSSDELEPGKATWLSLRPELIAHSGGLPSMLHSLSENFSFLPPQAMRLAAQSPSDSQAASVPVFAVVGHWKPARLAALVRHTKDANREANQPPPSATDDSHLSRVNSLPERMPQEVLLIFGQSDLFPYRIEYRRMETPLAAANVASPIPYQLSAGPLVVLELTDVAFDTPIAADEFNYKPGDADWVDQTAGLIDRLRRERETQLASREVNAPNSLPTR